jgi:DNA-binding CsgD family transcriptional regulator
LSASDPSEPLRIAIDIADAALADRIARALGGVEDIELVPGPANGDGLDAVVVAVGSGAREGSSDIALTARELEVLALMAEGASNKAIAQRLGISAHTAKFHVASVLEKLDAISRTDAVMHAARLGVIDL